MDSTTITNDFNESDLKNNFFLAIVLMFVFATTSSHADEEKSSIEYSGSGFLTLAAGKMLGGTGGNVGGYLCPCFVSDYAQAAIYDGRSGLQWNPDSKLGLQGSVSFDNNRFSITAQAVSRGAGNGAADLEWFYGSYKLNDKVTLQAGRKRLPMFYYSDAQDIGFSLPWTHLPTWLYGWQAVNYNGISMLYQDQFAGWQATADLLAGNENRKDSGYWKVYGNGRQSITNVNWTNIAGGDLTLSKDWFETRLVYIQSNTQDVNVNGAWNYATLAYDPPGGAAPVAKQQIYGLTLKADYQHWLLHNEFIYINHPGLTYKDFAQIMSAGYRYNQWLPMVTWGHYRGTVAMSGVLPGAPASTPNSQQTVTLSLRYDLTTSSDLKLQYDDTSDHSDAGFAPRYGSSRLLTFAYDSVF
ncbi:MAG: hypothetical protein NTY60_04740 [Proteobacteria bacterium]|nr:hypothetical protein [Pseudomonadota bacterium]